MPRPASYFLAAGAIKGGTVKVTGIGRKSMQGDIRFADVLEKMGRDHYLGAMILLPARAVNCTP
ncbi:3-phosphoshikimate 1-carboxyvinyltransferase [Salmonella enterica subsp. enterica]|uniref:3-phosphoshikimate 1-carboxyvinyltransferase n=1 Tax=Salmonella enterica I TaxID=59201 RepID=A0A447MV32_SALET|nr:3-phosphoshikimate 1-carboxyvinyltransferase [Salmonella enterica subsp. enterica]